MKRRLSRLLTSSAQAAVGLVHSHCTGFRSPRGTAYSWWFADLFVLRAAHTVTVRLLFWGCFFPLSQPPLLFSQFQLLSSGLPTACCNRKSFSDNAKMGLELDHPSSVFTSRRRSSPNSLAWSCFDFQQLVVVGVPLSNCLLLLVLFLLGAKGGRAGTKIFSTYSHAVTRRLSRLLSSSAQAAVGLVHSFSLHRV